MWRKRREILRYKRLFDPDFTGVPLKACQTYPEELGDYNEQLNFPTQNSLWYQINTQSEPHGFLVGFSWSTFHLKYHSNILALLSILVSPVETSFRRVQFFETLKFVHSFFPFFLPALLFTMILQLFRFSSSRRISYENPAHTIILNYYFLNG